MKRFYNYIEGFIYDFICLLLPIVGYNQDTIIASIIIYFVAYTLFKARINAEIDKIKKGEEK